MGAVPNGPEHAAPATNGGTVSTQNIVQEIDSLTREEAEIMAAKLFRALAKRAVEDGLARRRNSATTTLEAAQLHHLAVRLEGFANAE